MGDDFHELRTEPALPRPRWPRRAALALGVVLALAAGAHLALNSAAAAQAIRARALARLEERLGPCTLGPEVAVGWSGQVELGPLSVGEAGGAALLRVERVRVRPALGALLSGRLEPGAVSLEGVVLRTDRRGERLRALAHGRHHSRAGKGGPAAGRALSLALRQAWVEVLPEDDGAPVRLGPLSASLELAPAGEGQAVDARLELEQGGWLRAMGTLRPGAQELELEARGLPLGPLAPLGPPSVELRQGLITGTASVRAGAGKAEARVEGWVTGLVLAGERLAAEPVGPAAVGYRGTLRADTRATTLAAEGTLLLGPGRVELPFEASLEAGDDGPRFSVDARLGPEPLPKLEAALPPQLAPGPEAPHLAGPLRAELRASGPLRQPSGWTVEVKLDTAALKEQARAQPFPLREGFSHKVHDAAGVERTLWVGERNPDYAPLAQLPAWVPMAVVVSEDAGFYSHPGFDFDEIRESLAEAAGGARLRGGSTLTQQLVKNVYLTRERTLARKVREALITIEVEAALPKARIIEVYLNLIEWGPNVYGVGAAARYYFGVDARALSPKQAVFLASIIPNPGRFGPWLRKGGLTDFWAKRLETLLGRLKERGVIDEAQYQQALAEPLTFRE